jgi:hypothetical protein
LFVLALPIGGCCNEEVVATVASPDGSQTAKIVQISCGATAQNGTKVYLQDRPHWYSVGNGTEVAHLANVHLPQVSWVDSQTLKLAFSDAELADLIGHRKDLGAVSIVLPVRPLLLIRDQP